LMAANNTLSIFINDFDNESITYTGPDSGSYVLPTNSVAYWLNGSLTHTTLMENRNTANGTIFTSTNNIGRFAIASSSGDFGLEYMVDDLEISTIVEGTGPTYIIDEDYEADTVGTKPAGANVYPSTPAADAAVIVVGSETNSAGTGNGVQILDDILSTGARLAYDLASGPAGQLSAVRIDFSVAQLSSTNSGDRFQVSVGEHGKTLGSSSQRFIDCRMYADNTIDFVSPTGSGSSYNNPLLPANNEVSIFVNDLDTKTVSYIGPDSVTYVLPTNSVAYWFNGGLEATVLMVDQVTANGTIHTSTNNIGRFAFTSGSSDFGLNFVVDDIKISDLLVEGEKPEEPTYVYYQPFESGTVGQQPTGVSFPASNSSSNYIEVIDDVANTTGPGQGIRMHKFDPTDGNRVEYAFAASSGDQLSALRIDLLLAPMYTEGTNGHGFNIGAGQFDDHLASNSKRYINVVAYNDGSISFDPSADGLGATNAVPLLTSSNSLTMIINDYDAQTVDYTGLDSSMYTLPANSVAYWLNGGLVTFTNGAQYTSLDLDDPTPGGTVGTTEGNFGKFGLVANTSTFEVDYIFDEILVTTNLLVVIDGYADWLEQYPTLGSSTNLMDDAEPDGMNNLLEFALGGNPTEDDASDVLPVSSTSNDGGTKWLNYIYNRRIDDSLSYDVHSSLDLVHGPITNATEFAGASDPVNGFETATNRVPTDTENQQFMQLKVLHD
jgi:hypothetical protein